MQICSIDIDRGWKAVEFEAVLPGRPRTWYLIKKGYKEFAFPSGSIFPGADIANSITAYIECNVVRVA